ncbi:MAG: XrtA/PEP-CTERM system histidine kinase PrsK [Candidatus Rokuibacteriota bacterium]
MLLLAAVSSLGLVAVLLARRPRGWLEWSFALGMVGFALEAVAAFMLLTQTESPDDRLFWLRAVQIAGLLVPLPWGVFLAALISPRSAGVSLGLRLGVAGGSLLALAASGAVAALPAFQISEVPGPFYAARMDLAGRAGVIVQLLATVVLLAALEAALRSSRGESRWRIKYLVLGLGGIFLVRFYLLSHVLLFHVVMASYLATGAATLFVGNLVIGASLARERLRGVELAVSRRILYRSVVVGVLGLYLLVVGMLGWFLNRLGIPEELFWGSLAVFISALGLAAILLSEDIRWRIKRFIGLHFYRSKYDYREQWGKFTKRLGSLLTLEELAPQLLGAVVEAVGATKGLLYLADERDARYHVAGAVGISHPAPALNGDSALISQLGSHRSPLLLENGGGKPGNSGPIPGLSGWFAAGGVAVPLRWRGSLTGLMLIGPERTGIPYMAEDLEFLATVGEQAAGALATARLTEALAQSREFDAFHRLTSFVIHDLKNSISALSMLSQNALANFDDPEFQRDALKTLSRTVERMQALLAKLSSAPESAPLRFQPVDLAALVTEAIGPVAGGERVSLVKDLAPVPAVSGDPEALLRVIQNLVTNAVEALDGKGVVSVKTYGDQGWAVFSVTDTGCGIPEGFLRKSLFAPFRSTKKGGWGIGLYQAKGIVEAHGGTIEVHSKEGQGTTFWVRLPIAPPRREESDR